MPTEREREYYRMGFQDGVGSVSKEPIYTARESGLPYKVRSKPKRKLSAWNKFVKANSKKKIYRYAYGTLKLKKMGIAFRKTRAGRKR